MLYIPQSTNKLNMSSYNDIIDSFIAHSDISPNELFEKFKLVDYRNILTKLKKLYFCTIMTSNIVIQTDNNVKIVTDHNNNIEIVTGHNNDIIDNIGTTHGCWLYWLD